jgi:hypothetical protein
MTNHNKPNNIVRSNIRSNWSIWVCFYHWYSLIFIDLCIIYIIYICVCVILLPRQCSFSLSMYKWFINGRAVPIFRQTGQTHKKFTSQQSPSGLIGGSKLHPMDGPLLPHTTNCSIWLEWCKSHPFNGFRLI